MKIVRYHPRALIGDGGISAAIRGWTQALGAVGADVDIVYDPRYDAPLREDGLSYVGVPHGGRGHSRYPKHLEGVLEGSDLVVLHSGWVLHNVLAARAARSVGVPYLLEPRGAYDAQILSRRSFRKKVWWRLFEKQLTTGAVAIHAFFESERTHLRAMGYHGDVVVAPNGVEPRDDVAWEGGDDVVWLGRFDPEHKGLDLLVRGLALIAPADRPTLRLYGPDWRGQKATVALLIEELGLQDWIQICPPVYGADKWEVLRRARGFVYPSRWEGFGIALAEAINIGVPALVTPYPLGRFLAERDAVFMADATAESLAAGLVTLTSSARREEIGRTGARVVREELGWDRTARSWLAQLTSLGVGA